MNDHDERQSSRGHNSPHIQQIQQINRKAELFIKRNSTDFDERPTVSNQEEQLFIEHLKQRVLDLEAEIQALHNEYESKLADMSAKTAEKNEVFLNLIQQMQQRHAEEIAGYRATVESFQEEKKQMANIQNKMNQIGAGIEDILRESSELSRTNEELEMRIAEKDRVIQEMKKEMQKTNESLQFFQLKIDDYEKVRLKSSKKNKDILEMLEEAEKEIEQININAQQHQYNRRSEQAGGNGGNGDMCAVTRQRRRDCQHCKLSNLEDKYSKMLQDNS